MIKNKLLRYVATGMVVVTVCLGTLGSTVVYAAEVSDSAAYCISEEDIEICKNAPCNVSPKAISEKKTYEYASALNSDGSKQKELQRSEDTTSNEYGLRVHDGRYCIAVGTKYADTVGEKLNIVLSNGNIIPCIVGDVKAGKDTDSTESYCVHDGSVVEFIVDKHIFKKVCDNSGTVNFVPGFDGEIEKIVSDSDSN